MYTYSLVEATQNTSTFVSYNCMFYIDSKAAVSNMRPAGQSRPVGVFNQARLLNFLN